MFYMIGSLRAIKQRNKKMEKVAKINATYFGLGLSPKAPGTVGSLGTLTLVAAAAYF